MCCCTKSPCTAAFQPEKVRLLMIFHGSDGEEVGWPLVWQNKKTLEDLGRREDLLTEGHHDHHVYHLYPLVN